MSTRRVKDIAYEADDVGGEFEEEEDEEQMRRGTIKVKEALGSEYSASEKEIQDALWHYYYDIVKSVEYLKRLKAPKQQKQPKQQKAKQESRFDKAANASTQRPNSVNHHPSFGNQDAGAWSVKDFFADSPWGKVQPDRNGVFSHAPSMLTTGLLGGSSKPSKLAALAAARKKKEEEKRQSDLVSTSAESQRAISLLDRLGSRKQSSNPGDLKSSSSQQSPRSKPSTLSIPSRSKRPPSPENDSEIPRNQSSQPVEPPTKKQLIKDLRASPSMFAQALFGKHNTLEGAPLSFDLDSGRQTTPKNSMFILPYADDPMYKVTSPFAEPSPDDIVLTAQSKAKSLTKASGKAADSDTTALSEGTAALSVKESTKIQHKNLNVLEEYKQANMKNSASFVVIGHVDHGKSTLMGRLLYDLKFVDERTMQKLRKDSKEIGKASFALAWVMDATNDERSRGITVDTATSFFETSKTKFTILDAPGHQDFIPNMIAGASQADFAVLVIDAGTNSFESGLRGQTKEHALLVRSMGVQRLIVAINKMDRVDWSRERFKEIEQQMSAFLTIANFSPKNVSFIPCAGLTGENVNSPPASPKASWYKGPTLVEELDNAEPTQRALERPLRMTVSEVFRGGTSNPVCISGRIETGSLQVGDTIQIMPSGETATIKTLEADNEPAGWAVSGQIVTLNLSGIDPVHLRHGDIVSSPQHAVKNVKSFTAKILTFEHVMPMFVHVHRGALNVGGKISQLVAILDKTSGEVKRKKPKVVQPGSIARVVIELDGEMPLESGWRVVLRADGRSLAAGQVE